MISMSPLFYLFYPTILLHLNSCRRELSQGPTVLMQLQYHGVDQS
jgi:hypothetical protein